MNIFYIYYNRFYKAIWSLCLRSLTVVSSFLFSWIIARTLGASQSGGIFFLITLSTIIGTLASRGQDLGLAKAVARVSQPTWASELFYYSLKRSLLFFVFLEFALSMYIFTQYAPVFVGAQISLIFFFVSFLFLYMNLSSNLFQGMGDINMMVLSQRTIFNFLCFSVLAVFWLINEYSSYYEIEFSMQTCGYALLLSGFATFFIIRRALPKLAGKTRLVDFYEKYNDSCGVLYKIQIYQIITMYFSQIMISFFSTKSEIAGFIVSQRISSILAFFVLAVSGVVSASISKAFANKDISTVHKNAYHSFIFSSLLGVPISVLLMFFSTDVLGVFGNDFTQFSVVLSILIISQLINCLTGACDITLMFIDGEAEHKKNVRYGTMIAFISALALIPLWGAVGAAVSAAISSILINILDVMDIKKKAGFWIFSSRKINHEI